MHRDPALNFSEEFVIGDINNLNRYLINIEFNDSPEFEPKHLQLLEIIKNYSNQYHIPLLINSKLKSRIEKIKKFQSY